MSQEKNSTTRSKKSAKPSLTMIRKLLKEVTFNPKDPGPMKFVTQRDDPKFHAHLAITKIEQAMEDGTDSRYIKIQAIRLLLLSIFYGDVANGTKRT